MKEKIIIFAIIGVFVASLFLQGCSLGVTIVTALDDSQATPDGIASVVDANNQFALELYSELKDERGNIFYSPYSISTALAMTYEGAQGQTATEMQSVLHFPKDDIMRRSALARIQNIINKKDKEYKLSTANALWAQEDYQFLEDYTNTVEQYYSGKVTNLNFKTETEKSRQIINSWVEAQTNNKIKDLIPQGKLNPMTKLVLTNAIYFKGDWVKEFDKKKTREQDFRVTPSNIVKVPMMSLTGKEAEFNYAETDTLQILEMPYKGEELSMLILLPKEDLSSLEEEISADKLAEWKAMLREQQVNVYMPKFKFETKYFMSETLKKMGMPTAFSDNADFSGMDSTKNLFIKFVIHQAFVEVNEEGTEAAAATAVGMEVTSAMPSNFFRADHPFIFIIQEKSTGNILLLGRVMNPTK